MTSALIGHSGFVGSTLLRQTGFDYKFRSTDIAAISGRRFGTVVCAGAPAQKWIANREPEADQRNIATLLSHLEQVQCDTFVLISTVDVFALPQNVDESSPVQDEGLHAYGRHRLRLERFVATRYARHLIVRLPGLVGPGLRKNVIYDLHHGNNRQAVDSRGVFQFYPMVNLWHDIGLALKADLSLVHFTAEPVEVAEIANSGFGVPFQNQLQTPPARYDMRSRHASLFGGHGNYQYSARETLLAVRAYAQSEPRAKL
jgi:hypothetical protein